jgi:hypothetical protein
LKKTSKRRAWTTAHVRELKSLARRKTPAKKIARTLNLIRLRILAGHYPAPQDLATAAAIERGDWASLGPNEACGCLAVAGLLVEAERRGFKGRRLSLCNSGDTVGSRDRVVGYGAWMFA